MPRDRLEEADDRELVAAIGERDEAAMAEVMRRHRSAVVAFARRLVGDHARADEISQDVFVRLWERWDRFDPQRGALKPFLLAITHGRSIDTARSDAARRGREHREGLHAVTVERDTESQVVAGAVADALRAALEHLPEGERQAVELAYFGGHSYRAVATLLGEAEGTVKSRIRSGLVRLRGALAVQELQGA